MSKAHIDVLVNAAGEFGVLDGQDPQRFGALLWRENVRSVNFRYSEDNSAPAYRLVTTEAPLHPIAVLKAVACYQYQSCERPDWTRSAACRATNALREAVLARHPALAEPKPGPFAGQGRVPAYRVDPLYDVMPWGFSSLDEAEAHRYPGAGADAGPGPGASAGADKGRTS